MRKQVESGIHKIAQNADFAQSKRMDFPVPAVPWFLQPCIRHICSEKASAGEIGSEGSKSGDYPKVALYHCLNSVDGAMDNEIKRTMESLQKYAERNQYQVVESLCDFSLGQDLLRPGLSGILELAKKRDIAGVLMVSPSKISRNIYQLLTYRKELERCGVWMKFCDF